MAKDPDFFIRQVASARRFFLDLRTASAPGLVVACGGWELCAHDYRVTRPGFPWLGLEMVVEGTGQLLLAGSTYRLGSGMVFTYGPGIAHEIVSDPARPLRKYFLDLGGDGAAALLAGAKLSPGTAAHLRVPARARAVFDLLIEAGSAGGPHAPALCAALASAVVLSIAASAVEPGRAQEPAYATYLRCRRWLEERGHTAASLVEAARACKISSAYLCRLFRRYDRDSPWRLVRQRRLQHGAELLGDERLLVSDIAERLGYADAFHFSRAFSQCFGLSPQRFRSIGR